MQDSHSCDPGSIPGRRTLFLVLYLHENNLMKCPWFPICLHNSPYMLSTNHCWPLKIFSPNVGLEPTTLGLRVPCSTDWASRAVMNLGYAHKMVQDAHQEMAGLSPLLITNITGPAWFHTLSLTVIHLRVVIACQNLRGQPELNRRPLDLQSNALPLSYIPNPCVISPITAT